jgi:hypothetical protein
MSRLDVTTIVNRQINAMRTDRFEIGVLSTGIDKNGVMRQWSTETLILSIPWLKAQNANGMNINIRPKGNHLSLLDDITLDQIEQMRSTGYNPCVIVQTSPGNYQAWLDHGAELADDDATVAAQYLARKFQSDYGAASRRHFGRLAGFTNRKQKHRQENGQYPFVRLEHAEEGPYKASESFVEELEAYKATIRPATPPRAYSAIQSVSLPTKSIDDFRSDTHRYPKLHNADLAYAVYAVSHGVSDSEIRGAIGSRDLTHKGTKRSQLAYVERTFKKAIRDAQPR